MYSLQSHELAIVLAWRIRVFSLFFEIFTTLVIIRTRKMKNKIKKFFKLSFSISFRRSSLSIEWRNLLFRSSQCFLFARDFGSYFILYTFIRLVYYTNLIHASSWDRSFQSFERRRDQSKWEKFVSREIQYGMLIKQKPLNLILLNVIDLNIFNIYFSIC